MINVFNIKLKRNILTAALVGVILIMSMGHVCFCAADSGISEKKNIHHGCSQSSQKQETKNNFVLKNSCCCGEGKYEIQLITGISDSYSLNEKQKFHDTFNIFSDGNKVLSNIDLHSNGSFNTKYYLLLRSIFTDDLHIKHSSFLI